MENRYLNEYQIEAARRFLCSGRIGLFYLGLYFKDYKGKKMEAMSEAEYRRAEESIIRDLNNLFLPPNSINVANRTIHAQWFTETEFIFTNIGDLFTIIDNFMNYANSFQFAEPIFDPGFVAGIGPGLDMKNWNHKFIKILGIQAKATRLIGDADIVQNDDLFDFNNYKFPSSY